MVVLADEQGQQHVVLAGKFGGYNAGGGTPLLRILVQRYFLAQATLGGRGKVKGNSCIGQLFTIEIGGADDMSTRSKGHGRYTLADATLRPQAIVAETQGLCIVRRHEVF